MAKNVGYNPVTRTVRNGAVCFNNVSYAHPALEEHEGDDVLLDPVVDTLRECFSGWVVYNLDEVEICEISMEGEGDG